MDVGTIVSVIFGVAVALSAGEWEAVLVNSDGPHGLGLARMTAEECEGDDQRWAVELTEEAQYRMNESLISL